MLSIEAIGEILKLEIHHLEIMHKDQIYQYAFASDLMSDVLAMVKNHSPKTLLLTGLSNEQTIRTAEMLDISLIIYVRGKKPKDSMINLAKQCGITLCSTPYTMFEASGCLYKHKVKGCECE